MKKLTEIAFNFVRNLLVIYLVYACVFLPFYLGVWFEALEQPSLNPRDWSNLGRTLFSLYVMIIAPLGAALHTYYKKIL